MVGFHIFDHIDVMVRHGNHDPIMFILLIVWHMQWVIQLEINVCTCLQVIVATLIFQAEQNGAQHTFSNGSSPVSPDTCTDISISCEDSDPTMLSVTHTFSEIPKFNVRVKISQEFGVPV